MTTFSSEDETTRSNTENFWSSSVGFTIKVTSPFFTAPTRDVAIGPFHGIGEACNAATTVKAARISGELTPSIDINVIIIWTFFL